MAYGGVTPAGSAFAGLTSMGMTGTLGAASAKAAGIGGVAVAAGVGLSRLIRSSRR